jgi:ankyrin repeat protein
MSEALFEAISQGDVDGVRAALAAGARVHGSNARGRTPLFQAVGHKHRAVVELLLAAGADPASGLLAALMTRNDDLARMLVEHGFALDTRLTENGQTLLHAACDAGMDELARYLVERTVIDVHATTDDGRTALVYAEDLGLSVARLLRERGVAG